MTNRELDKLLQDASVKKVSFSQKGVKSAVDLL